MAKSAATPVANTGQPSANSAPAAAPTPAPARAADGKFTSAPAPASAPPERVVKEWQPSSRFATPPDFRPEEAGTAGTNGVDPAAEGAAPAEAKPDEADQPAEGAPAEGADKPAEEPAKEPTKAERRRDAMAALEKERRLRELEQTLKSEQDKARGAEEKLSKLPLSELLKLRGLDREQLLEELLTGGSSTVGDIPAKNAAPDPRDKAIEELRAEIAALKGDHHTRKEVEAAQQRTQAIQLVQERTKDLDIPITRIEQGGYDLVVQTAVTLWEQSGKSGHPRDYIERAAGGVEAHFRETKPGLAELVDKARGGGKPAADPAVAAAARAKTPAVGKRTGARPDSAPPELPMNKHERDMAIKREFGFG